MFFKPLIFVVFTAPFWTFTLIVAVFPLSSVTVTLAVPVFFCAMIFPESVTFTILVLLEVQAAHGTLEEAGGVAEGVLEV